MPQETPRPKQSCAYAIDKTGWALMEPTAKHKQDDQHQGWMCAYWYFSDLTPPSIVSAEPELNVANLKGKVALVTGVSRGIGHQVA